MSEACSILSEDRIRVLFFLRMLDFTGRSVKNSGNKQKLRFAGLQV